MSEVLIIDDNHELAKLMQGGLEKQSHTVLIANSAQDGEKILSDGEKPDIIFLNLELLNSHGLLMLENIKASDSDTRTIPVVIITGNVDSEIADICLEKGAKEVLLKPFTLDQIIDAIRDNVPKNNG